VCDKANFNSISRKWLISHFLDYLSPNFQEKNNNTTILLLEFFAEKELKIKA